MKNKILTSLALASLMSLYFVGCSSEPKSVGELEKLPREELDKMKEDCHQGKNKNDIECKNISKAIFNQMMNSREYHSIFDDNNKEDKK